MPAAGDHVEGARHRASQLCVVRSPLDRPARWHGCPAARSRGRLPFHRGERTLKMQPERGGVRVDMDASHYIARRVICAGPAPQARAIWKNPLVPRRRSNG
jgi:hypothetical protein